MIIIMFIDTFLLGLRIPVFRHRSFYHRCRMFNDFAPEELAKMPEAIKSMIKFKDDQFKRTLDIQDDIIDSQDKNISNLKKQILIKDAEIALLNNKLNSNQIIKKIEWELITDINLD